MRRGQRLTERSSMSPFDLRRVAAVAVLTLGLVSLAASGWRLSRDPVADTQTADAVATRPAAVEAAAGTDRGASLGSGDLAVIESLADRWIPGPQPAFERRGAAEVPAARIPVPVVEEPVLDTLMPSTASVYEVQGEQLDLVMVVDETLDV